MVQRRDLGTVQDLDYLNAGNLCTDSMTCLTWLSDLFSDMYN